MADILEKLQGGDRRSTGRSDQVAGEVLGEPGLFGELFAGLFHEDPVVRMRAADAVEKVTRQRPDLLQPYKADLLGRAARMDQQEVRWHAAQMIPRLELSGAEIQLAKDILVGYLDDSSRIVQANALEALASLAARWEALRPEILRLIEEMLQTGSPAVKARGRKLLAALRNH